jgi:hypothetical protein
MLDKELVPVDFKLQLTDEHHLVIQHRSHFFGQNTRTTTIGARTQLGRATNQKKVFRGFGVWRLLFKP